MVDPITSRRWVYRALFVLLSALVLFVQILPVTIEAGGWPGPDLILAMAMVWALRRPEYTPPLLVGLVFLTADLLLQRPPGLYAALVVLALEVLRGRNAMWRDLPLPLEWAVISALMAAVMVLNWLVQAVFMIDQASFGLYLIELIATVIAYPLVVAISTVIFGIRKAAPGEVDALGHPL